MEVLKPITPPCIYIVKARTAIPDAANEFIEFRTVKREFTHSNAIRAREEAFRFRNDFLYGILLSIGIQDEVIKWNSGTHQIEGLSEKEIREIVNPFLENGSKNEPESEQTPTEQMWETPDDTDSWYSISHTGVWVLFKACEVCEEIVIDKICRYDGVLPTPPLYLNLVKELDFYSVNGYDTEGYITSATFFDDEVYLEGEASEEDARITFSYLETPFDWSGYESATWWNVKDDKEKAVRINNVGRYKLLPSIELALSKGEHEQAEFKPGLTNRLNHERNIEYEVARSICAFLNSKGGYLFIGLSDNGQPVDNFCTDTSHDFFRREFTRIKAQYLPQFVAHSIYGEFMFYKGKEIYVVTVFPSEQYPIFLRRRTSDGKTLKEFYVRSDAASRHIYDPEELVKYCRCRWK